ncbi:N-acetylglucosamine-binding protein GbpA [Pantoea sp. SORGH_AS_0659]|uniref:N-acetylglucosamine-binding protein GbpA n=1 Tax=Pantoea sp. SORGH_AS_0659 TaxID=3062597 RepID=UPI0028623A4C|nr:N-acetylglucosamine-binding protein GbpA [Pantoea sp. SORGH_AS_0659]MDR6352495.1 putative carbohydrate-binding protein with CBM5 and CBM33 domain [Pantoea sp. SORGH_AS_0659]
MKLNKIALAVAMMSVAGGALAHGYIISPPERAALCLKANVNGETNANCAGAEYEPQSVGEGPDGFLDANDTGPQDGMIANGGSTRFTAMNEQSIDRWVKNKAEAGPVEFKWAYTAPHSTTDTKYYITKQDWDTNSPLTREAFESVPFCTIDGNGVVPPREPELVTHNCELPARSGYQAVLAVWDVADTAASFHKVIDMEYEDTISSEWKKRVGQIRPDSDLKAGSVVSARFFNKGGELTGKQIDMTIDSDEAGQKNKWAKAIAEKINGQENDLRAGQMNTKGEVNPVEGANTIYTKEGNEITSVIIDYQAYQEEHLLEVSGVQSMYKVDGSGVSTINYHFKAQKNTSVKTTIYNKDGTQVASDLRSYPNGGDEDVSLGLTAPIGTYKMVITATSDDRSEPYSYDITLSDATYPVYPEGRGSYTAGMLVINPDDNAVYECKPWPATGWCNSTSEQYYKPGTGLAWQDAWSKK